jgi:hypothetical protein
LAIGAPTAAAQQSGYETSPPPSTGSFKPSASVRAAQRAAGGVPTRKATKTKRAAPRPSRPFQAVPSAGTGIARAVTPKSSSNGRKHKHKHTRKHREPASTYNPPRTTTDMGDSPTFVTRVLREVPTGVWVGLLALAVLATALAAGSIASAVRARRMIRQRELLRADVGLLQSALLPTVPPHIAGVTVSAAYRPAGGPAAGGDFYDLFPLAN